MAQAFLPALPARAGRNACATFKPRPPAMIDDLHVTRRDLPHWTRARPGTLYWVTFRLADSIPQEKLRPLLAAREDWLARHPQPWDSTTRDEYRRRFPQQIETWLDEGYGSRALARLDIRGAVVECLLRYESVRLRLPAAVIMPTHVHALIEPLSGYRLTDLLRGIKGASARAANRLLGRSGAFWLEESYDRIVRDEEERGAFERYIADNPLRAGLRTEEYWLRVGV